jgi:hypothetical protein
VLLTTGGFTNFNHLLPAGQSLDLVLTSHTTVLGEVSEEEALRLRCMPCLVFHKSPHEYALPPIKYPNGRWYIKLGHDESLGKPLLEEEDVARWYRGGGDPAVADYLRVALQGLLPGVAFLSWETRACVISKVCSTAGCLPSDAMLHTRAVDPWRRRTNNRPIYPELEYLGLRFW